MSENNNELKELEVDKIFDQDQYIIPIYQRNYAWKESQIVQLLYDIKDSEGKNYYLGSLVVFKRENGDFEVIDGQQRLTTLYIILKALGINSTEKLKFEAREKSSQTLKELGNDSTNDKNLNSDILSAYKIINKFINTELKDKDENKSYIKYLKEQVKILRVEVPKDTDLNHYFEIMNNRGEQLEKHEILKASLLSKLGNKRDKTIFSKIWEACSDMNRYVQMSFSKEEREKIFGEELNTIQARDFDSLVSMFSESEGKDKDNNNNSDFELKNLISKNSDCKKGEEVKNDEKLEQDRFSSIIDFPNFLLQVLKLQFNDVSLDDKKLISEFGKIKEDEKKIKEFGYLLLKIRFLFDKYIIKREKDDWSLIKLKKDTENKLSYINSFGEEDEENNNKNLIMLLSMFHVSYPTRSYKNWLNKVLDYLNNDKKDIEYKDYLEKLGKEFIFEKYLNREEIKLENSVFSKNDILDAGVNVPNFIFNYLDYLLWKTDRGEKTPKYSSFEFTFRSSVEHYYPQTSKREEKISEDILNCFGNLCLISASKNSSLSNSMAEEKAEILDSKKNKIESIKQKIMTDKIIELKKNGKIWDKENIITHREEMIKILLNNVKKNETSK